MVRFKSTQDSSEVNFISAGISLLKHHVPVIALWHHHGEVHQFGSAKVIEWYKHIDDESKRGL